MSQLTSTYRQVRMYVCVCVCVSMVQHTGSGFRVRLQHVDTSGAPCTRFALSSKRAAVIYIYLQLCTCKNFLLCGLYFRALDSACTCDVWIPLAPLAPDPCWLLHVLQFFLFTCKHLLLCGHYFQSPLFRVRLQHVDSSGARRTRSALSS